eukprot:531048-Prymnesium_polylepis.1
MPSPPCAMPSPAHGSSRLCPTPAEPRRDDSTAADGGARAAAHVPAHHEEGEHAYSVGVGPRDAVPDLSRRDRLVRSRRLRRDGDYHA